MQFFIEYQTDCFSASRRLNAKYKHKKMILAAPKSAGEMLFLTENWKLS